MPSGKASQVSSQLSAVMAKLEAFLLNPLSARRGWAILAAGFVLLFLFLWLAQSDRVLLWAQTAAGNWSPPSPPLVQPAQAGASQPAAQPQFSAFEISLTGTLAIVLNIGALGLLAKTMFHVIKLQRRQEMDRITLKTLVSMDKTSLRNDIVTGLDNIPELSDSLKRQVTHVVNEKFKNHVSLINKDQLEDVLGSAVAENAATNVDKATIDRQTGALKLD